MTLYAKEQMNYCMHLYCSALTSDKLQCGHCKGERNRDTTSAFRQTWYCDGMCSSVSQSENRRNSSGGGRVDPSTVCSWGKVALDTDLPSTTSMN